MDKMRVCEVCLFYYGIIDQITLKWQEAVW